MIPDPPLPAPLRLLMLIEEILRIIEAQACEAMRPRFLGFALPRFRAANPARLISPYLRRVIACLAQFIERARLAASQPPAPTERPANPAPQQTPQASALNPASRLSSPRAAMPHPSPSPAPAAPCAPPPADPAPRQTPNHSQNRRGAAWPSHRRASQRLDDQTRPSVIPNPMLKITTASRATPSHAIFVTIS